MKVVETDLPGVVIVEPRVFEDHRGHFKELFHSERFGTNGLPETFVQDNVSRSKRGVIRGLHFQEPSPQGKLVSVLDGEIFDVAVDIRRGSPTFGRWVGATLSSSNHRQLYVPPGFAHGFAATTDATVLYKCTDLYRGETERAIRWDDPTIGIAWPVSDPIVSSKDAAAPSLAEASVLPSWSV